MTGPKKQTKIMIPYLIIVVTLFLVGASKVTTQIKFRKEISHLVKKRITSWHDQIAVEVTSMDRVSWQSNGQIQPLELLRTYAIEQDMNESDL